MASFLWPDAEAEGTKATLNPFAFWACSGRVYGQQFYPSDTSGALDDLLYLHKPTDY